MGHLCSLACIVDYDVDSAELFLSKYQYFLPCLAKGDVPVDKSQVLVFASLSFSLFFVDINHKNMTPLGTEELDNCSTESLSTACVIPSVSTRN